MLASEHERADADAERDRARRRVGEPERLPDVVREHDQEAEREEQQVAMDVLQDQRERVLAPVALARLADRAGWRIGPERLVVGAAVVIAGESEERRDRQDEQSRREREPAPATRRACGRTRRAATSPKISGE